MSKKINWCIEQHKKTNHYYSEYLPYEFHLRMCANVYEDFKHLLDDEVDYFTGNKYEGVRGDETVTLRTACYDAIWGHDTIEDCRVSFNEVSTHLGPEAADIIFAVTNEKGKNICIDKISGFWGKDGFEISNGFHKLKSECLILKREDGTTYFNNENLPLNCWQTNYKDTQIL